jgi:hypothetical protein
VSAETEQIRAAWIETYNPAEPGLQILVEKLIGDDLLLRRANQRVLEAEAGGDLKYLESALKLKAACERSFGRSLKEVEQFVGRRKSEEFAERRLQVLEIKESIHLALTCKKHEVELKDAILFHRSADRKPKTGRQANGGDPAKPGAVSRPKPPQEAKESDPFGAVGGGNPKKRDSKDEALPEQPEAD